MTAHVLTSSRRIPAIDALRGSALIAMAIYHFAWDLEFFGLANPDVTGNPFWYAFSRATAGSFLVLVGISLVLAHGERLRLPAFLRRLAIIALAAAAITVASFQVDPEGPILFGILHCIAVSSVLGLAFLHAPLPLVIVTSALFLTLPQFLATPLFNGPQWVWVGLGSEVIPANDYNPLLPWFGAVLAGIAIARLIPPARWPRWVPQDRAGHLLTLIGRNSLIFYLVHQPVLMGLLWSIVQLRNMP